MKRTLTVFLLCCLSIAFSNYSIGQGLSDVQKSEIENQVDSVFHKMIKYAESLDYDKLVHGTDDKYNAGFIVNGAFYERFDSLMNVLKLRSQAGTRQEIVLQKEKITVLSENIVVLTAYGESKVFLSSGNQFTTKFFWSFVYGKINNDWKVIQSHQSGSR